MKNGSTQNGKTYRHTTVYGESVRAYEAKIFRKLLKKKNEEPSYCVNTATCNAVHFYIDFFLFRFIRFIYYRQRKKNRSMRGKLLSLRHKFLVIRLLISIIN